MHEEYAGRFEADHQPPNNPFRDDDDMSVSQDVIILHLHGLQYDD